MYNMVVLYTRNVPACAEGSVLGTFSFDKLKNKEKRKTIPNLTLIKYIVYPTYVNALCCGLFYICVYYIAISKCHNIAYC